MRPGAAQPALESRHVLRDPEVAAGHALRPGANDPPRLLHVPAGVSGDYL